MWDLITEQGNQSTWNVKMATRGVMQKLCFLYSLLELSTQSACSQVVIAIHNKKIGFQQRNNPLMAASESNFCIPNTPLTYRDSDNIVQNFTYSGSNDYLDSLTTPRIFSRHELNKNLL